MRGIGSLNSCRLALQKCEFQVPPKFLKSWICSVAATTDSPARLGLYAVKQGKTLVPELLMVNHEYIYQITSFITIVL